MTTSKRKRNKAAVPTAAAVTVPTAPAFPRVYVGPQTRDSYLRTRMVLADGYPPVIRRILAGAPWFAALFVAAADYPRAVKDLARRGSALCGIYERALSLMEGRNG